LRKKEEIVIWPIYFDSTLSRAKGRKIPKKLGKHSPTFEMVEKTLNKLKIPYESYPKAVFPRLPWKKMGFFLIKKTKSKNEIIKDIARELKFQI
jgi:signal recognition particle subunit SRP19